MKTFSINVPDMQSSHCQMRVRNGLNQLSGLSNLVVSAGLVHVSVPEEHSTGPIEQTITKLGYSVAEIRQS